MVRFWPRMPYRGQISVADTGMQDIGYALLKPESDRSSAIQNCPYSDDIFTMGKAFLWYAPLFGKLGRIPSLQLPSGLPVS